VISKELEAQRAVSTYFFPEHQAIDVRTPTRLNGRLLEMREVLGGRRIRISFNTTSPDVEGDYAETGWVDEEGVPMEPDEYDIEDGKEYFEKHAEVARKANAWLPSVSALPDDSQGACYNAIKFLDGEGVWQASSSQWHHGLWYSGQGDEDFQTGEETTRDYHLANFDPEESRVIHAALFHPNGVRRPRNNPSTRAKSRRATPRGRK
jgi:hypothetical protein